MQETSRLRLWFWLTVVPAGAIFILTILLRQSAEIAADKSAQQERVQQQSAYEQAQQEREATRVATQKEEAARCSRLARGMLERRSDDALLIFVSRPQCEYLCELGAHANRLTEQYAGLGLRGLWVTTAQPDNNQPPTPSAMVRMVVPDCAAFLGNRTADFVVLGRNGAVTHPGLAAASAHQGPLNEAEATMLDAVRQGMATR